MKIHTFEQYSDEFWLVRNGNPSASKAKALVTSSGQPSKSLAEYAVILANDVYTGESTDSFKGTLHTDNGTEREPVARSLYEMIYGCEVKEIGMFTDDDETIVASPDGIIGDNGILEIKCQSTKCHTQSLMYYKKHKKPPTNFVAQCQMQLYVSGFEWVDLFFYNPQLPELTIRIHPIKSFHEMLECQIEEVIEERDNIIKLLKGI